MVATQGHEAGLVRPLDGVIHAIRKGITGDVAVCGAGRIETRLIGRFDDTSGTSCLQCIAVLTETASSG